MPTAALLVSSGIQAGGQILGGIQQNEASKVEATQLRQQGQVAATEASARISANDTEAIKALSAGKAAAGASGVATNSGSVRAVQAHNESQAILNDTYAKYQGNLAEQGAYFAATNKEYEGKQAETAGFIGAGSTALTAFANAKGMQAAGGGLPKAPSSVPWYNVWSS